MQHLEGSGTLVLYIGRRVINPLNLELNPICSLLALLAHHFLHVSRIRVKSLTLRLLMSYIHGAPILDVSRSHTTTNHSWQDSSGRVISSSQRPLPNNTQHSQQTTHPCPRWDSNPRSQQASGRRPTPQTAPPLGPAHIYIYIYIYIYTHT